MSVAASARRIATATLLAGALSLTACSSSGGGGSKPSEGKVVSQLQKDKDFGPLLKQLPSSKRSAVADCVAKVMEKGIDAKGLNDFVNGKTSLSDLGSNGKVSEKQASAQAEACVTKAVG